MATDVVNSTGFYLIDESDSTMKAVTTVMDFSQRRIFMGLSYLVLCILGSTGNILLSISFYQTWSQLGQIPFYLIATQLIIVDFCIHLSQLIIAIPTTLWLGSRDELGDFHANIFVKIISILDTVGFIAGLYFSFVICINRFCVLYLHWGFRIFERPRIYFLIGGSWIGVLTIILASNAFGCLKVFSQTKYFFFYTCGKADINEVGRGIINGIKFASYGIPVIMGLIYLRTFIGFDARYTLKYVF